MGIAGSRPQPSGGELTRAEATNRPPRRGFYPGRSGRPTRVLVADDRESVRRGLRVRLTADSNSFEICAEAASGREAVEKVRQLQPDVIALDVSIPELDGLEMTRLIVKDAPKAEILILTIHKSEPLIEELLDAGAESYLLMKSEVCRHLPEAIESLHIRSPFSSSKIPQDEPYGYVKSSGRAACKSPLTPAERRVLQLLAEGKSNKEVANLQAISVKTAETHRANIMRKLELRSVSDVVHYAIRNDIIEA
jgi:DNA-binding NarL/FixJ family response regulator